MAEPHQLPLPFAPWESEQGSKLPLTETELEAFRISPHCPYCGDRNPLHRKLVHVTTYEHDSVIWYWICDCGKYWREHYKLSAVEDV